MRRITLNQSRPDCLEVHIGADRQGMVVWGLTFAAAVALLVLADLATGLGLLLLLVSFLGLPPLALRVLRLARAQVRSLVRTNGRLLLDGEPLELGRVELRVLKMPITNVPTGYALSLWVMTAAGPEDLPIGRFGTLLEASALSGQLEEFVQRANLKQHRHA